ncbi:hypothetical protein ATZ33_15825 [Enterococcus silesiacus]|uniref:Mga helix-turn-helix domain-containing protein n=1 Tax=Enterococcus silesiacus TaxID=332949 RepID=A0A0S3KET1_9ENTE|nr:helix-turn-helix domain-containing protein [Enterococcus silesiacus]ALS02794.1 hypothetical protein ATZ33_15825 [Enterococcus silesiacus]OJG87234.1 hypothetical protein RV15_GL001998 [Enterococcus silesiacus]
MNILLKKNNLFKLQILSRFSTCSTTRNQKKLTEELKIDNHKLKKQISILNEDLYVIFKDDAQIVKVSEDYQLVLAPGLDSIHVLEITKLYYLKETTAFEILRALFKKNYYSIDELAGDLHLTSSYVYKQLTRLNKILNPLGIKLVFTQNLDESNFLADEISLSYFIFSFYWSSFKTKESPLHRSSLDESKVMLYKLDPYISSTSKQEHLRHYISYSIYHTIEKKRKIELDEQFVTFAQLLEQTNDLSIYQVDNFSPDLKITLTNENLFLNFILRTFLAIETPEEQIFLAKKFIETKLPLIRLSQQFIDAILDHWKLHLSDSDYYTLLYRATIVMIFIRYVGISFYEAFNYSENFTKVTFPTYVLEERSQDIKKFHTLFKKKYPQEAAELAFDKKYHYIAYSWIHYIIDYANDNRLKIAIHFSKDTLSELFIQNKIRKIYNEELITFVQKTAEADIVIADFAEPSASNENIIYIENIFEESNWNALFYSIQKEIFKKTFV